ncbi:tRNA (adenosine(37)-N6)-dimethylallyltransferase MiaA [Pedobacter nutrimenti]|uniref:tRNA dimethylallyltransferase n=1 Tax=Pedobacter nutrimenti TaxID=1241337 RepID=A0A318UED5_9SPHI|nr:tRNA (adenosine(37)-N6)-dimethylallyltransferase MiaA [Pedobacter nutrimenti]PYF72497.1 tRNA dimethylallyltransferase [Pedobacter nutrimenti]
MRLKKDLIVIVGPTAIGKTSLAIQLARQFSTEIISADSRQFFKEMEIGTAKPSPEELQAAKHHFINSHSINTFFSTGDFENEAINTLDLLFKQHDQVIMVGGSGLYINAVCYGLDDLPDTDLAIRAKLNEILQHQGIEEIKRQLQQADPEYFAKVDQANPQRMVRGLEFFLSTGSKLSAHLTNSRKQRPFNIIKIGLHTEREKLYERINLRVDQMIGAGLVEEVKNLLPHRTLNALRTVGYSEIFDYLDGHSTLEHAISSIKQNTRRFAKRQLTWFRKDQDTKWFEPDDYPKILAYLKERIFG